MWVFGILLFLFLVICVFVCLIILIQSDKGGGISGAIGGGLGGVNNFLGSQDTANWLTKGTYIFGGVFLLLCILMTFFAPGGGEAAKSAMQRRAERVQSVTPMPVSAGGLADFADGAGADEAGAPAAGSGPTIVGDVIEGGRVMRMGEDGVLRQVEEPAGAE
jgi:preprotein translocase subunit SecG